MQSLATVQSLNIDSVYDAFITWINKYKENSRMEYIRNVNEFFMFMHGKTIENITKQEIETVTDVTGKRVKLLNMHVEKYKQYLKQKKNTDSSIIRKIYAIRSLYKYLRINGYDVDHLIFDSSALKNKPKSYGFYTPDEVKMVAKEALNELHYGEELYICYLLAAQTSIRLNALLSLKWSNISKDEKSGLYIIETIDKNDEEVIAPFEQELHHRLIEIKNRYNSDKLFPNLKPDKVEKSLHRINNRLGFSKTRRLTFHSLRKVAINYGVNVMKDIKGAQEQGRHKSVQVMIDRYTQTETDFSTRAGIQMMKEANEEVFDLVNKKELLEMLKEMNIGVYNQLALKIERMVE
ncbi:tyrosine-type recombinase/integrase [Paenibacillus naphthalenovorans]|uniref:Phage integrase n=1 Tax=Paenibacillus naphthalenovorans TaxID=162209 RepID=A0A0U2MWJ9_9BACL|nr:tyrosine-type recombinase/integrase [Paenibacillus naphthalenovorans]ALS22287.1 phage integrase [Paenibacillus naphthalenovorans]